MRIQINIEPSEVRELPEHIADQILDHIGRKGQQLEDRLKWQIEYRQRELHQLQALRELATARGRRYLER